MEYITKEAVQKCLDDLSSENLIGNENDTFISLAEAKDRIEELPTADVVPKSEYDAVVSAVDNSTKEFMKLHDDYQKQKVEIDKCKQLFYDAKKVIGENAQRGLEVNLEEIEKAKTEVATEILDKLDRFINSNCIEIKDERGTKGYVTSGVHFAIAEFKNRYIPQNDDRCVVCGEIIPEGRQVCLKCQIEKGD